MSNPGERLRFTSITLKNWRNFADMTVALPRLAYLVGANGSGKSNFLDAIRFLHELGAVGGGLRAAVRNRGGMGSLRHLAAPLDATVSVLVEVGNELVPNLWTYELQFDGADDPIVVRESLRQREGEDYWRSLHSIVEEGRLLYYLAGRNASLFTAVASKDVAAEAGRGSRLVTRRPLVRTYFEDGSAELIAADLVDLFDSIRYVNINPQIIRNPGSNSAGSNGAYGGALLESINTDAERDAGRKLAIIADILSKIVPEIADLKAVRGSYNVPHLYAIHKDARLGSQPLTEAALSDGTLRLIGMLWSLLDGDGPLLLEEPEQSWHAGLVQYIPLLLSGAMLATDRQIMVSTHSTELLDSEGIEAEQVLMLQAEDGASTISQAASIEDAAALLAGGEHMSNLVLGLTEPPEADLLATYATVGRYGRVQTNGVHDSKQGAEEGQQQ